jgi:hypothetical protein
MRARHIFVLVLLATVAQLAVAVALPGLPQFSGKAFAGRLIAYPVMILAVPLVWWLKNRRASVSPPWTAFAWIALPFLVDTTGNTLDLYDRVEVWDDVNHLVNWVFLCLGAGFLVVRALPTPRWAAWLMATGLGAILAIGWEIGEWYTFIRHGTELATAYTDTLGDLTLGTLGGAIGGFAAVWWSSRQSVTVVEAAPAVT